jgi:hypothetical protein
MTDAADLVRLRLRPGRTTLGCHNAVRGTEGLTALLRTPTTYDPGVVLARTHHPAVATLEAASMSASDTSPVVTEILCLEDLPLGSRGSRRAIARWSDGSESEALTWYADEILICEGDLVGKTRDELRSVHFGRDRDWLQS